MTQKQRENFYRTSTVIVEHGKEVLVLLLEDDLLKRNLTLIDFINLNKHGIYHLCYNKNPCCQCTGGKLLWKSPPQRVLYPSQLDILFDKTGPKMAGHNLNVRPFCCCSAKRSLSCAYLDLTLLRCLLVKFAPSCIGAVRQDVEDLIKYRNNLHGHSEDGKMSSADYSVYKIQIERVILSIAKQCNKEKIIRQKLEDAAIRPIDDTICTQFQNILLDEIRREMDKNETIVDMQVVIEQHSKKLDNIERSANEINRRGRDRLVKFLFSSDLVCCGLIFTDIHFDEFILLLLFFSIYHFVLAYYLPRNLAKLISSVTILCVTIIIFPSILIIVILPIELCFVYSISVYFVLVSSYEAVTALILLYYLIIIKNRFQIRNYSRLLYWTISVLPFCFCFLYYLWPHISTFVMINLKAVIAIPTVIIGLIICIYYT
ncbi:uncharacterized protein LOC127738984 [Mytilus californianus]|uniref:uncharacterized protein LOC127738984 n=1 Tax=Mytilus californianus TaxID=6549 RepID=UPI00224693CB|nr:uncharacterized protein LOC127738984 [Mytilus californianus]